MLRPRLGRGEGGRRLLWLIPLLALALQGTAGAHDPSTGSLLVDLDRRSLEWRVAVRDIGRVAVLDVDADGTLSKAELGLAAEAISSYARRTLLVRTDEGACRAEGSTLEGAEARLVLRQRSDCPDGHELSVR